MMDVVVMIIIYLDAVVLSGITNVDYYNVEKVIITNSMVYISII